MGTRVYLMTLQFPLRLALFKCADGGPGRSERVGEGLMSRHPARARVLIVDHHPLSNEQIKGIVAPHFEVVDTVCDSQALPRAAFEAKPDVILINSALAMEGRSETVTDVLRQCPNARVVLYPNTPQELDDAIAGRNGSESVRSPNASTRSLRMSEAEPAAMVTNREYEVLALLAAGYPMKQIAFRLGITYRTVTFHKYSMMHKLGIKTNAGLVAYALERDMSARMADVRTWRPAL
jgi:DNA-binding NarL/FixJ family response regulator